MNYDVYLAAPFFSDGERVQNLHILSALEEAKLSVFYPARDGIIAKDEMERGNSQSGVLRAVWNCDTKALSESKTILAILDGRTVDEGVCVEIGYASALGKYTVGFHTDDRSCFVWGLNPMVSQAIDIKVSAIDSVIQAIGDHIAQSSASGRI